MITVIDTKDVAGLTPNQVAFLKARSRTFHDDGGVDDDQPTCIRCGDLIDTRGRRAVIALRGCLPILTFDQLLQIAIDRGRLNQALQSMANSTEPITPLWAAILGAIPP